MNQRMEERLVLGFGASGCLGSELEVVTLVAALVEVSTDDVHRVVKDRLDKVCVRLNVLLGARLVFNGFFSGTFEGLDIAAE